MNKNLKLAFCLFIVTLTFTLLITGSPILTSSTPGFDHIPLGTFITWAGMIALPYSILFAIDWKKPTQSNFLKLLYRLLQLTIILAILWVPISYLLSGNLSFSFSEKSTFQGGQKAMKLFWTNSYVIVASPLLIFCLAQLLLYFQKIKN